MRREVVAGVGLGVIAGDPEVVLDGVSKRFASSGRTGGPPAALDRVTLSVMRGEIVVVVGPSGCGKSTALRMVAGLDEPDAGTVTIAGRPMKGVAPQDRDVAMVFQGYALYPQMTARDIIEFPLKMRGATRAQRTRAVDEAAATLRIETLLDRRPGELSGGERQRVAIARAVVGERHLLLADEPSGALDSTNGEAVMQLIADACNRGVAAVVVTHDAHLASWADRVIYLRDGHLVEHVAPDATATLVAPTHRS